MIEEAAAVIRARIPIAPRVGVVLGSGLGAFAEQLSSSVRVPYRDLPHWPRSTAAGHAGQLVAGLVEGVPTAVLAGRAHLYEGYTVQQVVFGLRVMLRLGVRHVILTNAAGGIDRSFHPGILVLISDHINLQGVNPLVGPNDDSMGPRFPDMSEAYSKRAREIARSVARTQGIDLREGVYAGMLGPSYETPAEIRYLERMGAQLVGMSTVAETIVAHHAGVEVLAISCVTNMAAGILPQKIQHDEVLETGARVQDQLVGLLRGVIPRLVA